MSLERRREVVRRRLPSPQGKFPIVTYFDFSAPQGWKNRMQESTVAHLSRRPATVAPRLAAGARYADAARSLLAVNA